MPSLVVACYTPKPGCAEKLLQLVHDHLPPLRAEGLVTPREAIVMRSGDGTILEIFEWISQEAIASAHGNPVVLGMWEKFGEVCTYVTPASLPELQTLFGHFEPV